MPLGRSLRLARLCLVGVLALAAAGYAVDFANQSSLSPDDRADRQIIADCKRKHHMQSKGYDACIEPVARRIIDDVNKTRALR
jgi:hypothetical protein